MQVCGSDGGLEIELFPHMYYLKVELYSVSFEGLARYPENY